MVFSRFRRARRSVPARGAATTLIASEVLEPRRLFAIVEGTEGDDVIVIEHNGVSVNWTINGENRSHVQFRGEIDVDGLGGNDHITFTKTVDSPVVLTGGAGRDTFVVGGGDLDTNFTRNNSLHFAHISFTDTGPEDSVVIDDSTDTGADPYRLSNVLVFPDIRQLHKGGETPFVNFPEETGGVTLRANGASNAIDVNWEFSIAFAVNLTIEGNGGDDTINFNTKVKGRQNGPRTRVIAAGGDGNDTVNLNEDSEAVDFDVRGGIGDDRFNIDLANNAADAHDFRLTSIRYDGGDGTDHLLYDTAGPGTFTGADIVRLTDDILGLVQFLSLESAVVNTGDEDNVFNIEATPAGCPITINAGGGADTFNVGGSNVIDNVNAPLRLNGQTGSDSIVMSQNFDGTDEVYTLTSDALRDTTFSFLTWSSIAAVDLSTGNQPSTIFIDSTAYALTLNTRTGVDAVVITNLAAINGSVDLTSPLLGDTLVIDAGTGTTDEVYTLGGDAFDATGFANLTFRELATLTLIGNAGDNVFHIADNPNLVNLTVHGGAGNDTFNVEPSPTMTISVDGDAPIVAPGDRLILDPQGTTGIRHVSGTPRSGTYSFTNRMPVSYESMEVSQILPLAPSTPNLAPADDSGSANTDNITNDTSLTFIGAGPNNHTITLRNGATVIGAGTVNAAGDWAIPVNLTVDGTYTVTATATDPSTGLVSAASAALTLVLDRVAPAAPTSAPDLQAASDTGPSSIDNVTNDTTPQFTIAAPPETFFRFFRGGVLNGGSFRTGTTPLAASTAEGPNSFTYAFVDAAGNVSAPSPGLTVTVDTIAPGAAAAPDLLAAFDNGLSSTDNLTNAPLPRFAGSASPGILVHLLADGVAVGDAATAFSGAFEVFPDAPLAEGTRSMTLRLEDPAGNLGPAGPALSITLDFTAPPRPGAPDLDAASDSRNSTDDVTNDNTPTFTGRTPAGPHRVGIFTSLGSLLGTVDVSAETYALTAFPTPDGSHLVVAQFMDAAGNVSLVGPGLPVVIDTTAPRVLSSTFAGHPQSRLDVTFNEDVPGVAAPMMTVVNLSTGLTVPVALSYSPNTGQVTFPADTVLPAGSYRATVGTQVRDVAGNAMAEPHAIVFTTFAQVVLRRAFANNSALDGNDPAANAADDAAVFADKTPLLPGQVASFLKVTTFDKGLNGITVDVAGLPAGAAPGAADFELAVGNGTTFTPAPAAAVAARSVGAGVTRLTLTLPDRSVRNTWLRVTLKTNANTGLAAPDVFYFGNLAGDTGGPGALAVNATDLARVRDAIGTTNPTTLNRRDFNRDGRVTAADVLITRANLGRSLPLFTAPAALAAAPVATGAAVVLPALSRASPTRRGVWTDLGAGL